MAGLHDGLDGERLGRGRKTKLRLLARAPGCLVVPITELRKAAEKNGFGRNVC